MSEDLMSLREKIDLLDKQLWDIIAARVAIAREIGEWKRLNHEPIVQAKRYQEVMENCLQWGKKQGLSEEVISSVMEAIHKESIRVES